MLDRILYSGKWLSVIERDGWYVFSREATSKGVVYILVLDKSKDKPILGRFEICPAHSDIVQILTSITGGINIKRDPLSTAVEEIYEEAGYKVNPEQVRSLGKVNLTKSTDTIGYLYAVNVAGLKRGKSPGDGSFGEIGSYCDWVSVDEAIECKCPVMSTLLLRCQNRIPELWYSKSGKESS